MAGDEKRDQPEKTSPAEENDETSKKRKLPPDFGELDEATVLFTIEGKKFTVHKDLACHFSPFLAAAFNRNLVEGTSQSMKFKDTTVGAFSLFTRWVYTGRLENRSGTPPNDTPDLVNLVLLADKFLMPHLQNEAIQEVLKNFIRKNQIPVDLAKKVYKETTLGHPLRQLFADSCALSFSLSSIATLAARSYSPEFLLDMIKSLKKKHGTVMLTTFDGKQYTVEIPDGNGEKAVARK